ncbi:hypothetical protein BPOR_0678g00020 [Botrytis porri]|uniref:O-methyltransferase C-terminal domain-containing protein n=1 Tax=Botrytis porri TaxID=87229 RepID=A0A4Z1KB03_9HELO|nr:hypothetical protein BPOR_0678g00020 [Botrytis porri]
MFYIQNHTKAMLYSLMKERGEDGSQDNTVTQSRIAELASIISTHTTIVDEYFQSHGIASPSFDVNYSETSQISKEISASKSIILEATEELNSLIGGLVGVLTSMNVDEIWPAFTRMVDAIERWPDSQEPNETGYNLATNQFDTYFEGMKKSSHREKRFADVLTFFHAGGRWERAGLIEHYNWEVISAMCIDLARHHPKMKCISQDLPDMMEDIEAPEDLRGRVDIVAHNFFTEQPVKGADAYLFRWIFHDWSDKYSIRILQNLIPALKHKAQILIGKVCLPKYDGNTSLWEERRTRGSDFITKSCLNGRERDADEWAQLFEKADWGFKFQGIAAVQNSRFSVIEAIWEIGSAPGL